MVNHSDCHCRCSLVGIYSITERVISLLTRHGGDEVWWVYDPVEGIFVFLFSIKHEKLRKLCGGLVGFGMQYVGMNSISVSRKFKNIPRKS